MGGQFGACPIDDGVGILLGEFLELVITIDGLLNRVGLIAGDVAGDVLAVFPGLKLVVAALLGFAHNGQLATLHACDLCDLFKESSRLV